MPFDEEDLDPHGECDAEIKRLRAALQEMIVAHSMQNVGIDASKRRLAAIAAAREVLGRGA